MPPSRARARARGKPDSHDLVPVPGDAATDYVLSRLPPVEDDVPLIVLCGVTDHAETRAALGKRQRTFLMTLAQVGHVQMPYEYDLVVTPVVTSYLIKLNALTMDTPLHAALLVRDARTAAMLVLDAQIPAARASDVVRIALFEAPSPERRVPLLDLGPPSPHAKSLLRSPAASLLLL